MKKKFCIALLFLCGSVLYAQESKISFSGSPVVTLFANYHAGIGRANKVSGFELDRSYLGYRFKLNDHLGGQVVFDVGPTKITGSDLERVAYIKNAMLTWTEGDFSLDFGLVKLEHCALQENFWGYQYILKSFNQEYQFGSSADMGVIGKYRFNDWLSADVTFINGEGYKKLNKDNRYRYGAGITAKPLTGLTIRAFYDISNGTEEDAPAQSALALFAGYKTGGFSVGGEYNRLSNTKFAENDDRWGISCYSTVSVCKKTALFGRYDLLETEWEVAAGTAGQRILAGVEYRPNQYLCLSPNFTVWNPREDRSASYIYFNLQFKL